MDLVSFDKSNKFTNSNLNSVKRSVSTLNISYNNPENQVRASLSFTNGVSKFSKQHLGDKDTDDSSDENILKDNHVFYIWTKQINSVEPFMVFEDMLTYQGRKYSEDDIAPIWKKDCRMWLWKTKQRIISKKVNRISNKKLKQIKSMCCSYSSNNSFSGGDCNIMDCVNALQKMSLN